MTKGEETRRAILEHGLAVASEAGLEGLSIGGLAREVGLSKSGLFAHFDSKENLQIEVLKTAAEHFVEEVITPALKEPRGEPRVREFFDRWLLWADDQFVPGGCVFIAASHELDDRPGPARDYLIQAQRDCLGALSTAARIAVSEEHFRADLDLDQFAYDFYSIILAYHHFERLLRDPDAQARARAAFEELIRKSRV